jgi:hypothetical protein
MPTQDLVAEGDENTAILAWVDSTLEHARARGQTKLVGYLEEVADEVVFEATMALRRASLVG